MAHFAELDGDNNVIQVIVVNNLDLLDSNGIESEEMGIRLCKSIFGENSRWVQTSYNSSFRRSYAGPGMKYDSTLDVFYNPYPPYPSWSLDDDLYWQPPVPKPSDVEFCYWDESIKEWVIYEEI